MLEFTLTLTERPQFATGAVRAAQVMERGVRAFGDQYVTDLQAATPRGRGEARGKRLSERYDTDVTSDGISVTYRITNQAPYWKFVTQGRGPIVARPGRVLRFVIDGVVYFRKRVRAAKANPFHLAVITRKRREWAAAQQDIRRDVLAAMQR